MSILKKINKIVHVLFVIVDTSLAKDTFLSWVLLRLNTVLKASSFSNVLVDPESSEFHIAGALKKKLFIPMCDFTRLIVRTRPLRLDSGKITEGNTLSLRPSILQLQAYAYIYIYYIHTEKYSPKSYVVNFRTQISSSQSGSFCRYRKALYFWSLGISLYLELFCFLSFITIVLRNLCSGTHRRNPNFIESYVKP